MKSRISAFALCGALAACSLGTNSNDAGPLVFSLQQVGPDIMLQVSTEKEYSCSNYQLEAGLSSAGTVFRVNFTGDVTIGQICLTALGPARYSTTLPLNVGSYSLELVRGDFVDRYAMTVTPNTIEVVRVQARFTRPAAQRFPRAP